jgi:hypothetical protein
MGETSIPCTEATRDVLREDKTPGVSWDRYLTDLLADAKRATDGGDDVDSLASAIETIETRTGRMERQLEQLTEGRR